MLLLRSHQPRFKHYGNSSLTITDHDDVEANKGNNRNNFSQRNKAQIIILNVFLCCTFLGNQTNNNQVRVRGTTNNASSPQVPLAKFVNNITESESSKPKSRRQIFLEDCEPLCDLLWQTHIPDPYFGYFSGTIAHIDCERLFESELVDKGQDNNDGEAVVSPKIVPMDFHHDYAMNRCASIPVWYIDWEFKLKQRKTRSPDQTYQWSHDIVGKLVEHERQRDFGYGNYQTIDRSILYHVMSKVAQVKGQSRLVVGSKMPWVEAMCLTAGFPM